MEQLPAPEQGDPLMAKIDSVLVDSNDPAIAEVVLKYLMELDDEQEIRIFNA